MKGNILFKNFTYLVLGQGFSMFGTNILKFTISLYILNKTGSAALFGLITALSYIPPIFLSPFGGILADRQDKRKLMVSLDISYGIISLLLGLIFMMINNLIVISILLIILSIISSFETPVVQSSVPLIQSEDKIIKSNSIINQVSMISGLIAPFLAGFLYGYFGNSNLYYVMYFCAICFIIAVYFELFLVIPKQLIEKNKGLYNIVKDDFKVAIKFTIKDKSYIGATILLNAIFLLLIQPLLTVGVPYIICIKLGLSANWNGTSQMLMGIAGVIGGMFASLIANKFRVSYIYIFFVGMGIALIPITLSFLFELSSFNIFVLLNISCFIIFVLASIVGIFLISSIQKITLPNMLGRVMSFYTTVMNCALPFGMWLFGYLYEAFDKCLYIILGLTGVLVVLVGLAGKNVYQQLEFDESSFRK